MSGLGPPPGVGQDSVKAGEALWMGGRGVLKEPHSCGQEASLSLTQLHTSVPLSYLTNKSARSVV